MSDQKLIIGYYRLSMEDDSEGESNSIINQRKLVKDYISNIQRRKRETDSRMPAAVLFLLRQNVCSFYCLIHALKGRCRKRRPLVLSLCNYYNTVSVTVQR